LENGVADGYACRRNICGRKDMGMNKNSKHENNNRTLIRLYQYAEGKVFEALERNEYMLAYIYSQAPVEICEKLYPFYGREKDEKETVSDRSNIHLCVDRDRVGERALC
jgi:hypothetical protein